MGAMNYLMQMDPDALATYPESHRAIIEGRPAWATSGFAIAVFGGSLGSLLLLLRKSAAVYLFMASLLGTVMTMVHTFGVVSSTVDFSLVEIFVSILMPLVVVLLIWYSKQAESKGWIS